MKKITRESLKKAEKGSGVYTMGSVYKLPDTWTPTFDLSNHEKVSARNDYAEKPLKKVVEEIVERKMEIGCSGICRILSGLSLIISMTV